jgi:hypothetical protein
MGTPKKKRSRGEFDNKLINEEPVMEFNVRTESKFYFHCETYAGNCKMAITAPTLNKALEKLIRECNPIRIHSVKEQKVTH